MAGQIPVTNGNRWSTYCFIAFCALFAVFLANVLLGKADVALEWDLPFLLNDVGEYLTLLFAALFFTAATLIREHHQGTQEPGTDPESSIEITNSPD